MLRTLFFLSVIIPFVFGLTGCGSKECKVRLLESIATSNGELKAVINENICDGFSVADTSISQTVSIVRQNKGSNEGGQLNGGLVFAMDAEERPDARMKVRWLSNSKLEISVAKGARIGTWITALEGVDVVVAIRP